MSDEWEISPPSHAEGVCAVGNIATPVHSVRNIFTLTPTQSDEDWAQVTERLRAVPATLAGYRESLALGRILPILPADSDWVQAIQGLMTDIEPSGRRRWWKLFS